MTNLNLLHSKINYGAIWILAKRELLGFWRSKARIISSLVQSLLFLFVFGAGFTNLESKAPKCNPAVGSGG